MAKPVLLSADSTCDLSPELIEKYHVLRIPLHVLLEEKSYRDGVDLTPDEIYRVYREKKVLPKTAAINAAGYAEIFRPYLDQGYEVVHIALGSALSSTCHNSCLAAQENEGLYVVDSASLSSGSGLLVIEAAERIAAGMPAAQVAEEVRALVPRVRASFVIDSLEFLHKGGRCSALAMLGSNLLQIKPCIVVDEKAGGKMSVGKKYRGALERVLEQYVADQLQGRTDLKPDRIFITHGGIAQKYIDVAYREIPKYADFKEILVTHAGCTICSHCGPGTLGVLFLTK